jgi:hypothetical protein
LVPDLLAARDDRSSEFIRMMPWNRVMTGWRDTMRMNSLLRSGFHPLRELWCGGPYSGVNRLFAVNPQQNSVKISTADSRSLSEPTSLGVCI